MTITCYKYKILKIQNVTKDICMKFLFNQEYMFLLTNKSIACCLNNGLSLIFEYNIMLCAHCVRNLK